MGAQGPGPQPVDLPAIWLNQPSLDDWEKNVLDFSLRRALFWANPSGIVQMLALKKTRNSRCFLSFSLLMWKINFVPALLFDQFEKQRRTVRA